jgi:hypothetical protein
MVPPVTVKSADPVLPPLHATFVPVIVPLKAVGSVIVTVSVVTLLFASVTVTVYVTADKPVAVAVV